ncbi:MAG: hypothetical protein QXU32_10540 [Nitrososphaerales archaeon]
MDDLDDICLTIRELLSSSKNGLKYNDIIEKLKYRGSRATINKHLRHLEEREYVTCKLIRTNTGRSTIYQLNPTPSKIITYKPPYHFLLSRIILEIPNTADTKIHHTMIYTFRNQSDGVQEYFGMHIFGDVSRNWQELNPHIYEEEGGKIVELDSKGITVRDDGLRKSISVKFNSPLYQGRERTIRFEYDWEEPNQYWEYSKGENPPDIFEFELAYPSRKNYKLFVYEVDPLTQRKKLSVTEPKEESEDGRKMIRWQNDSPEIGEIFRFEWREE